jgi:hypothetical protein
MIKQFEVAGVTRYVIGCTGGGLELRRSRISVSGPQLRGDGPRAPGTGSRHRCAANTLCDF